MLDHTYREKKQTAISTIKPFDFNPKKTLLLFRMIWLGLIHLLVVSTAKRPNVLIIIADDLGRRDVSFLLRTVKFYGIKFINVCI